MLPVPALSDCGPDRTVSAPLELPWLLVAPGCHQVPALSDCGPDRTVSAPLELPWLLVAPGCHEQPGSGETISHRIPIRQINLTLSPPGRQPGCPQLAELAFNVSVLLNVDELDCRAGATDFELEGQLVQEKGSLAEGALF